MAFLQDKDKETLIKFLQENLEGKVTLKFFTQELECETCQATRALLQEVVALSPLLNLEVYNFILDKEKVKEYGIDKIPAIVVEGEKDYGIRFYGIPSGYEFSGFIETLFWVSRGNVDLLPETQEALRNLPQEVSIQVFVTLTCPYCAQAVVLAHKMAIASEKVSSAMVEVAEFPHLAQRYAVRAVPKVVINEKVSFEGAYPEEEFLRKVIEASAK
ncbi:protein disulfide oxidoreductase [Atrimonas thermophila]|uniref:protein disulfide oxidoreductase n=1 Tax=Atrimonas thermophila TaxID=3064161 RepID=UPI00399C5EAC